MKIRHIVETFIVIILILITLGYIGYTQVNGNPEQVLNKMEKVRTKINIEYAKAELKDVEPPIIELKGQKVLTLYEDETYKEEGYTVKDNVDKELEKEVTIAKQQINHNQYQILYTVQDKAGNKATATRTINLQKREKSQGISGGNSSNIKDIDNNEPDVKGPNTGVIYLTFDDGPSTDITPKILNILAEENVKVTFFILNYNTATENLVRREAAEGHSIGIHGYSHDYNKIYQSVETYMQNVTKLQSKIKRTTGITTYITRFPGGSSNTVSSFNPKIMTKLTKEVVKRGFRYYDWNVSSGDAGGARNKDAVYRNVTKNLMRNRNNVVLMHDFSGNNKTLDALRAIIQYGKKNGYIFRPITSDTPMITHPVYN